MGFRNPVVAGIALARPAIESTDYVPGVSGWAIFQDGSAEFNDITIRGGTVEDGLGLYYSGTPSATTLLLSVSSTAGTDSFHTAYPAGIGLFMNSVLIGEWNSTGLTLVTPGGTGVWNFSSNSGINQSPQISGSGNPALDLYQGNMIVFAGTFANQWSWVGPVSVAGVDPLASRTSVNLYGGGASGQAQGVIEYYNTTTNIVYALQWGPAGGALYGTATAYQPGAATPTYETWHNIVAIGYANGWGNFGSGEQQGRYKIDANNRVWLDGDLAPGTYVQPTTIFTLPVGYRPVSERIYEKQPAGVGGGALTINILPSGVVQVNNIVGAAPGILGLSGISFPID